jgi:aspartate aminotransferase
MISGPMDQGMRPLHVRVYPYHNKETHFLELDGTMRAFQEAEAGDVLLLHACALNSTGIDPARGQRKAVSNLCSHKRLFPLSDLT